MTLFRFFITVLAIQSCTSQFSEWIVTHHEGYISGFSEFESDIGLIKQCKLSNIPIITSNPYIQKTISLKNFKPFAHTMIAIDYVKPSTIDVQISIQNKTYDSNIIKRNYMRQMNDDCLGEDSQYCEENILFFLFKNSKKMNKFQ